MLRWSDAASSAPVAFLQPEYNLVDTTNAPVPGAAAGPMGGAGASGGGGGGGGAAAAAPVADATGDS